MSRQCSKCRRQRFGMFRCLYSGQVGMALDRWMDHTTAAHLVRSKSLRLRSRSKCSGRSRIKKTDRFPHNRRPRRTPSNSIGPLYSSSPHHSSASPLFRKRPQASTGLPRPSKLRASQAHIPKSSYKHDRRRTSSRPLNMPTRRPRLSQLICLLCCSQRPMSTLQPHAA